MSNKNYDIGYSQESVPNSSPFLVGYDNDLSRKEIELQRDLLKEKLRQTLDFIARIFEWAEQCEITLGISWNSALLIVLCQSYIERVQQILEKEKTEYIQNIHPFLMIIDSRLDSLADFDFGLPKSNETDQKKRNEHDRKVVTFVTGLKNLNIPGIIFTAVKPQFHGIPISNPNGKSDFKSDPYVFCQATQTVQVTQLDPETKRRSLQKTVVPIELEFFGPLFRASDNLQDPTVVPFDGIISDGTPANPHNWIEKVILKRKNLPDVAVNIVIGKGIQDRYKYQLSGTQDRIEELLKEMGMPIPRREHGLIEVIRSYLLEGSSGLSNIKAVIRENILAQEITILEDQRKEFYEYVEVTREILAWQNVSVHQITELLRNIYIKGSAPDSQKEHIQHVREGLSKIVPEKRLIELIRADELLILARKLIAKIETTDVVIKILKDRQSATPIEIEI